MKSAVRFLTFVEQVRAAHRMADLGQTFHALAEDFGHTIVCIMDATKLESSPSAAILFHTMPKAQALEPRHAMPGQLRLRWAEANEMPFLLENVRVEMGVDQVNWNESLPPFLRGLQATGFPVHREGKLVWYVECAGPRGETSQLALSTLHAAAHIAYDRRQAFADDDGVVPGGLSRREGACIRWIAAGKTDEEISAILRIAPRTVRFHVASAKRKLGVSTRVQAVAARLQSGGFG